MIYHIFFYLCTNDLIINFKTKMLMNKILRYSFVVLLTMIFGNVSAQEFVFDFTDETNPWGFPTEQLKETGTFTKDGKSVVVTTTNYTRWFSDTKVLLFGKKDATLTLPAFDFDVERIDVVGASGASGKVTFNIFVGDEAVSTEVTGAKGTAIFKIADGKQAAGTVYTIKNTNDNNNQISKILIWKKGTSGDAPEPTHIENTVETAYTVAEAIAIIDKGEALSETVYVKGIVSQVDSYNDTYHSITYWISDDGTTTNQFEVYSGKGLDGADFASVDDVKVGAKVIIKGNIKKYNTIYEFDKNNQLVRYEVPTAKGQVWDFTQWSDETKSALIADAAASKTSGWSDIEKKADAEADKDPTEIAKDNCFWFAGTANADGTLSANGVVIKELKGLKFDNADYLSARSLAIAVNYGTIDTSKDFGPYHGPSYLWLGGKEKKCFTIPDVAAGSKITIEAESHKITDARGIQLKQGDTQIGTDFKPTTFTSQEFTVTNAGDVEVWNTNGCHIYTIKVEAGAANINTIKVAAQNGAIYNLAGQKVGKDYKGIVIMNGKKFMQK